MLERWLREGQQKSSNFPHRVGMDWKNKRLTKLHRAGLLNAESMHVWAMTLGSCG
jgi:hypothetical protein